jgi:epoxide hydrolase-like predicted phosphatase
LCSSMNNVIKAIIFDVGGVLVRTFDHSGRQAWEHQLGLPPGGAEAIVLNSDMGHRAQRGEITSEALWVWVGDYLNLGPDLAQFRHDFWRGDYVDGNLVELVRRLRRSHILAIISNATDALHGTLVDYNLADEFDLIVGSAYEGIMKPNPAIYQRTLDRIACPPESAVFIDDAPANVAGAQAIGMNAILFGPAIDLTAELAGLGIQF